MSYSTINDCPSSQAPAALCSESVENRRPGLLRRINPLNWYDEFSNIPIGFEETGERAPAKIIYTTARVKKLPWARLFSLQKLFLLLGLSAVPLLAQSQQNTAVEKAFASLFPKAGSQRWIKNEKALFAYFNSGERKSLAVFTLQGEIKYSVAYLEASDLSADINKALKSRYPLFTVLNVEQISFDGNELLQIVLESTGGYVVVQAIGGEFSETKRLKKHPGIVLRS